MNNTELMEINIAPAFNRRKKIIFMISIVSILLIIIAISGIVMSPESYQHDYSAKRMPPSLTHPFGTDHMGRDMFARTVKGLSTSILLGVSASFVSGLLALILGVASAVLGKKVDKLILAAVDIFMGVPHLVLLMLISIAMGKGFVGVAVGIMFTHWPNLTRVIRGEVLEIRSSQYIKAAGKFGKIAFQLAIRHILPHVIPQFIVGIVLLFPHAILHEAAITFLGFGLPVDMPAIGIILSEAMNYLSAGMWWLVVFPGAALLIIVLIFEALGDNLKSLLDPKQVQE